MYSLKLVLKKKWYNLIARGIKREEYREIKDYYTKRLFLKGTGPKVLKFNYVTFYLGYHKNRPSMTFRIKKVVVDEGRPEWGAVEGQKYYVIVLGERIILPF